MSNGAATRVAVWNSPSALAATAITPLLRVQEGVALLRDTSRSGPTTCESKRSLSSVSNVSKSTSVADVAGGATNRSSVAGVALSAPYLMSRVQVPRDVDSPRQRQSRAHGKVPASREPDARPAAEKPHLALLPLQVQLTHETRHNWDSGSPAAYVSSHDSNRPPPPPPAVFVRNSTAVILDAWHSCRDCV